MTKAVEHVRNELIRIRTGKATTTLLDGVKVDYYGTLTPLNQVGNLSTPDIHTITVQVWDKGAVPLVEKQHTGQLHFYSGCHPGSTQAIAASQAQHGRHSHSRSCCGTGVVTGIGRAFAQYYADLAQRGAAAE